MATPNKVDTGRGQFIGTRLTKNKVTIWIEGMDSEGAAVAGTNLTVASIDKLLRRLTNLREKLVKIEAK